MPQDYVRRPRTYTRKPEPVKSKIPGWVWLFTGTVLGAFIMFLMRLSEIQPNSSREGPKKEARSAVATAPTKPDADQKEEPRFNFYTLLKETEVPVPDFKRESKSATPQPSGSYMLQVASFKTVADADQLRAELILLNLDARVETAKVRNGETWHRVLVGPFTSRSKLAKARSTLVSNRYEALVLKLKPTVDS